MPGIKVHPNESFDEAYRKFKKQVDRNLVVTEVRARRFLSLWLKFAKNKKFQHAKKCLKDFICLDATSQDSNPKARKGFLYLQTSFGIKLKSIYYFLLKFLI